MFGEIAEEKTISYSEILVVVDEGKAYNVTRCLTKVVVQKIDNKFNRRAHCKEKFSNPNYGCRGMESIFFFP